MAVTSDARQSATPRWREFFLLERRLAAARQVSFKTTDPGWPEFMLGRALLADANQLVRAADGVGSSLVLYRAAVVLLSAAHRARPAQPAAFPASAAEQVLLPADETALAALRDEQRAAAREVLLAQPAEEHLAKLSEAQRQLALEGLQHVARLLADILEKQATAVPRISLQRWLRIGTAAGLALFALVWAVIRIIEPENLARDKGVSLSSEWIPAEYPARRVVDGDRKNIGFHTQCSPNQWVRIDLGSVETIERVHVFNRADCCKERAVPLSLELSTDGDQFNAVSRRAESFEEWEVELTPTPARFVRLTNESNECFHLSEIEVY